MITKGGNDKLSADGHVYGYIYLKEVRIDKVKTGTKTGLL